MRRSRSEAIAAFIAAAAVLLLSLRIIRLWDLIFSLPMLGLSCILVISGAALWNSKSRRLLLLPAGIFLLLILMDAATLAVITGQEKAPASLSSIARYLYSADRNIVQFEDTVYDNLTTYRLKPGTFNFSNAEYNDEFMVNSAGFRDDEDSLAGPNIIVLGDSFAMGWGVSQEMAFPQQLERMIGTKVLNTGIASYGTARELMLLDSLDSLNASTIIIQYDQSDIEENLEFHGSLNIMGQLEYDHVKQVYKERKKYFPGKYTLLAFDSLRNSNPPGGPSFEDHAIEFYRVLAHFGDALEGKKVIVVVLEPALFEGFEQYNPGVELILFDISSYKYMLDDHMTNEGHRRLAEEIEKKIRLA